MVKLRYYARKKTLMGQFIYMVIYIISEIVFGKKGLVKETKSSKMLKVGLIVVYCLMCRLKKN